ncbi:hypothetical protein PIB30_090511, partial [Stylosanthes scabra]|nr:hypothetical protein [Stylosanthes scabra]
VDIAAAIREPAAAIRESNAARDRERQRNGNSDCNGDERLLRAQQVPQGQQVEFAAYLLQGNAQHWWKGIQRLLGRVSNAITWDEFRKEFYKKYLPQSTRSSKDLGLLQFKQGRSFTELVEMCKRADDCCQSMAILRNANSNCHCETLVATLLHEVATLRASNQPFRSLFHRGVVNGVENWDITVWYQSSSSL